MTESGQEWAEVIAPDGCLFCLASTALSKYFKEEAVLLPDLSRQPLVIAHDASGLHPEARYRSFAYLVCSESAVETWLTSPEMASIRKRLGEKEISYKHLGSAPLNTIYEDFIQCALPLPGVLICFAVDAEIQDVVKAGLVPPPSGDYSRLSGPDRHAMVLSGTFLNLIVGGLTKPRQDVILVSDKEPYLQSPRQREYFKEMVMREMATTHLLPHSLGKLSLGIVGENFRTGRAGEQVPSRDFADCCSLPDLLAGATYELLQLYRIDDASSTFFPDDDRELNRSQKKAARIIRLLSSQEANLKTAVVIVTQRDSSKYDVEVAAPKVVRDAAAWRGTDGRGAAG